MFEGLKKKVRQKVDNKVSKDIQKSVNEGTIRTGSIIVEGLIFFGLLFIATRNPAHAAKTTTVVLQNCTIILH